MYVETPVFGKWRAETAARQAPDLTMGEDVPKGAGESQCQGQDFVGKEREGAGWADILKHLKPQITWNSLGLKKHPALLLTSCQPLHETQMRPTL